MKREKLREKDKAGKLDLQEIRRTASAIEANPSTFDQSTMVLTDQNNRVARPSSIESYAVFSEIKGTYFRVKVFLNSPEYVGLSLFDHAQAKLGLSREEATELFYPNDRWKVSAEPGEKGHITAEHAVKCLNHLADTGEVDWEGCRRT